MPNTNLTSAQHFANVAADFVSLVSTPAMSTESFPRDLLQSLTQLYAAAIALPGANEISESTEFSQSSNAQWSGIYENISTVFGERDYYWLVFDPIMPRDGSEPLPTIVRTSIEISWGRLQHSATVNTTSSMTSFGHGHFRSSLTGEAMPPKPFALCTLSFSIMGWGKREVATVCITNQF